MEDFIKTPPNSNKREKKFENAISYVQKLISDYQEKEEGEDYVFDQFRAEDDYKLVRIKCRVVEERKRQIQIETELTNGVKIRDISFRDMKFSCKIFGMTQDIKKAKETLRELLINAKNKLKRQFISLDLYKYLMENGYFDPEKEYYWESQNTYLRK